MKNNKISKTKNAIARKCYQSVIITLFALISIIEGQIFPAMANDKADELLDNELNQSEEFFDRGDREFEQEDE